MLAEVFAEEKGFAVQHVFMPAAIYYYTQDVYKFFTVIYMFESFEYLFSQFDDKWAETQGDSLVGDILLAILGMIAVRWFDHEERSRCYGVGHVLLLALASFLTVSVPFFWNDDGWAFAFYGTFATLTGLLIGFKWAVFTLVNVVLIGAGATSFFTKPFSHTPIATIISVSSTTGLYILYCIHNMGKNKQYEDL